MSRPGNRYAKPPPSKRGRLQEAMFRALLATRAPTVDELMARGMNAAEADEWLAMRGDG